MPFHLRPTMFLCIGGTGKEIAFRLARRLYEFGGKDLMECEAFQFVMIDTDGKMGGSTQFDNQDELYDYLRGNFFNLQIHPPNVHNVNAVYRLGDHQLIQRHTGNTANTHLAAMNPLPPIQFLSGGMMRRDLGNVALHWHIDEVVDRVQAASKCLKDAAAHQAAGGFQFPSTFGAGAECVRTQWGPAQWAQPTVYVLGSLAGGTGSGMAIDVAALVRAFGFGAQTADTFENARLEGHFMLAHPFLGLPFSVLPAQIPVIRELLKSNSISALREIETWQCFDRNYSRIKGSVIQPRFKKAYGCLIPGDLKHNNFYYVSFDEGIPVYNYIHLIDNVTTIDDGVCLIAERILFEYWYATEWTDDIVHSVNVEPYFSKLADENSVPVANINYANCYLTENVKLYTDAALYHAMSARKMFADNALSVYYNERFKKYWEQEMPAAQVRCEQEGAEQIPQWRWNLIRNIVADWVKRTREQLRAELASQLNNTIAPMLERYEGAVAERVLKRPAVRVFEMDDAELTERKRNLTATKVTVVYESLDVPAAIEKVLKDYINTRSLDIPHFDVDYFGVFGEDLEKLAPLDKAVFFDLLEALKSENALCNSRLIEEIAGETHAMSQTPDYGWPVDFAGNPEIKIVNLHVKGDIKDENQRIIIRDDWNAAPNPAGCRDIYIVSIPRGAKFMLINQTSMQYIRSNYPFTLPEVYTLGYCDAVRNPESTIDLTRDAVLPGTIVPTEVKVTPSRHITSFDLDVDRSDAILAREILQSLLIRVVTFDPRNGNYEFGNHSWESVPGIFNNLRNRTAIRDELNLATIEKMAKLGPVRPLFHALCNYLKNLWFSKFLTPTVIQGGLPAEPTDKLFPVAYLHNVVQQPLPEPLDRWLHLFLEFVPLSSRAQPRIDTTLINACPNPNCPAQGTDCCAWHRMSLTSLIQHNVAVKTARTAQLVGSNRKPWVRQENIVAQYQAVAEHSAVNLWNRFSQSYTDPAKAPDEQPNGNLNATVVNVRSWTPLPVALACCRMGAPTEWAPPKEHSPAPAAPPCPEQLPICEAPDRLYRIDNCIPVISSRAFDIFNGRIAGLLAGAIVKACQDEHE